MLSFATRSLEADFPATLREVDPAWLGRLGRKPSGAVHEFVIKLLEKSPEFHQSKLAGLGLHGMVLELLASLADFPERTHQVGVYGLGKCQRLIALLRRAGYERPSWLHGALRSMTDYYVARGLDLGAVPGVADAPGKLAGEIVLSPPSATLMT